MCMRRIRLEGAGKGLFFNVIERVQLLNRLWRPKCKCEIKVKWEGYAMKTRWGRRQARFLDVLEDDGWREREGE